MPVTVQAVLAARIDRLGPGAKRLLQVASVVGRDVDDRALGLAAGLEREAMESVVGDLIAAGFLFEAELYPRRVLAFRHPLTREVAYSTQLADQREATHAAVARAMIELSPDRHDELSALIAQHFREGGEILEAARWSARAAHWAGHSRPRDSLRLWHDVMVLSDQLKESEEKAALAIHSRLLQLQYAWRVGMSREEQERLAAEAEAIAARDDDLHSLVLLRLATAVRPGLAQHMDDWLSAVAETNRLADESGDPHLRVAVRAAGAYALLTAGDFDGFEAELDAMLELADGDPTRGAGLVLGSPIAWAIMGKGMVRRERGELDEAERLIERSLRVALEADDPETASWARSNQAALLAMRGDVAAALALGRRNCELTDRLGDVFSRSLALANLAWAQVAAEQFEEALASVEDAERLYREAMDGGGEMAAWRVQLRARALIGLGRPDEALEAATWAAETARDQGLMWTYPVALLQLGRARAACGMEAEAAEALDEAARVARASRANVCLAEVEAERAALAAGRAS